MITQRKKCPQCKETKPLTDFYKRKDRKSGYKSICKLCDNANGRKWKEGNSETVYKNKAVYRQKRKGNEKDKLSAKIRRLLNLDQHREYDREWTKKNPEKRKENSLKWLGKNPEKIAEYNHKRIARVRNSEGQYTAKEWKDLKERYNYTCLACRRREPEIKLTPDHVLSLHSGGTNYITNIQPLCLSCNSSKGAKHIDYR
jgi:hypothetical protein